MRYAASPQPERVDIAQCTNLPVTLVFLPAHDIPMFVGEGNVDMGIAGLDVVQETSGDSDIDIVMVSVDHLQVRRSMSLVQIAR